MRKYKVPDGGLSVLFQGLERVELLEIGEYEGGILATTVELPSVRRESSNWKRYVGWSRIRCTNTPKRATASRQRSSPSRNEF